MSPKVKYHLNWNVTKSKRSLKQKCHRNLNDTETEISPKLKYYLNLNGHQTWNFTDTEVSLKL